MVSLWIVGWQLLSQCLLVFLKGNFGLEFKRLAPKVAVALNLGVLSERIPRDFCSNRGFRHSAAHPMTTQASGFPNSHLGMSTALVFVNCICLRQKQCTSHPWVRLDQNLLQPIVLSCFWSIQHFKIECNCQQRLDVSPMESSDEKLKTTPKVWQNQIYFA